MFSGRFEMKPDSDGEFFIDRDGEYFHVILNFLRDGEVDVPEDQIMGNRILREAKFYNIEPLVQVLSSDAVAKVNAALQESQAMDWKLDANTLSSPIANLSDSNCRTITKDDKTGHHVSICGDKAFLPGSKTFWRVRINQLKGDSWIAIGVSSLKKHIDCSYNQDFIGWSSANQGYFVGVCSNPVTNFIQGDTVEVLLDCVKWTLQLRNPRTNQIMTMDNLPPASYAPHFNLHTPNNSLTVIPALLSDCTF
jgi:hypothetical protein